MKNKKSKTSKGFTLIELLVVILIIGVIASIAVPKYKLAVAKSRYATVKNLAKSLYEAQRRYALSNNKQYTNDFSALDINMPPAANGQSCGTKQCFFDWGFCSMFPSDKSVSCNYGHYGENKIGFDINLKTFVRRCVASSASGTDRNIYDKVCKSETGRDPSAGSANSSTRYYTYPN